ncbi:MAG: reverse transcriptase family protein [Candidatus Thiodiazotropha endolucinida]|nr:reverse transcriptase family protein [Candidatus Thiodiazotropha taylori]MCW4260567.1 reverse transcriptase family protein [Candidatus Thiodiazotropha endolucinida]
MARDRCKRQKRWTEYKFYRNRTRNLIRKAKRQHFKNSIENLRDTRGIWRHLKDVHNGNTSSGQILPDELTIDGEHFTDSETIATKFNEFFTSITQILENTNSSANELDVTKLEDFIKDKVPDNITFNIPLITIDQVSSYIRLLDTTKSTGLDGIGPKIIKLAENCLSPHIAALINKSINTGTFPNQLKYAKVLPVYKTGQKADPSNYRPISILPTISKIFEKHINKHLMNYLNKYKLLHESQSGFRQKHSCQTALIKLVDQWMSCIDKGDLVGALFIDFRKAFDVVDHSILIKKLSLYKMSETSLQWFRSYLTDRKQAVKHGKGQSNLTEIKAGVPQGSILGPTLFLLFINDLPLFTNFCFSDFYADDATLHTHSKSPVIMESNLQTDADAAKIWGKQNKMHINFIKTTCMFMGSKHKLNETTQMSLNIDGHRITNVSQQKLLGLLIDDKLTWTPQIDSICSALSSKISLLRQLSTYVSTDVLKLFYQGYILPLIDYGSVTWSGASSTNLDRILKLQKRAARIILRADFDTPSATMFKELGWQPINKRLMYNKAVLTYKALNDLTPDYISNLLKPVSDTQSRTLRSSVNGTLAIPRSRTSLYDGAFSTSAPRLWNSLPISVRNATSLNSFKNSLKEIL